MSTVSSRDFLRLPPLHKVAAAGGLPRAHSALEPDPPRATDLTYTRFVLILKLYLAALGVVAGDVSQPAGQSLWDGPPSPSGASCARTRRRGPTTTTPIAMLGIDLGKNICSLAGLNANGSVVLQKKMTREGVVAFTSALVPCIVAMEACCGAPFLWRTFASQGHTVRLMSLEDVQPSQRAGTWRPGSD